MLIQLKETCPKQAGHILENVGLRNINVLHPSSQNPVRITNIYKGS